MPKWIRDCKICNDGLVIRMHELKESGHSDRASVRIMVDEAHKAYPELTKELSYNAIHSRWKRHGKGLDPNAAKKRRKEISSSSLPLISMRFDGKEKEEVGHNDPPKTIETVTEEKEEVAHCEPPLLPEVVTGNNKPDVAPAQQLTKEERKQKQKEFDEKNPKRPEPLISVRINQQKYFDSLNFVMNKLIECEDNLPKKPPQEWEEKRLQEAKARVTLIWHKWNIIQKRLEAFNG